MARLSLIGILVAAFPLSSWAKAPPSEPTETVVTFTVKPMPSPKPALKYQLLPELAEMNPGNPIPGYLKCFMEQQNFFHNKAELDNREKWQTMPLAELPVVQVRHYGKGPLTRADEAARLDTPDWQILMKAKTEGYRLLLPEVQTLRALATALKVRFRGDVVERRFDDAIVTAKTMLALSRHLGEHPTLIGDMVGIAIGNLAVGPLEEMMQQPGCPNLYWALTDLPHPFIDLRKAVQGERMFLEAEFVGFDQKEAIPEDKLDKTVTKLIASLSSIGIKRNVKDFLDELGKNEIAVQAARKRLVDSGLTEAIVNEMPAVQVIILDQKVDYEMRRDELMKWMTLPYWEAEPNYVNSPVLKGAQETLFGDFINGIPKVKQAQARIQQRFALLRHLEALRLYAAEHDGKLPATLEDVGLPLPPDPFTGKPFIYKVEDQTATIKGTPPKGMETTAIFNVKYVVTIKK
jgi:hypothetical protein